MNFVAEIHLLAGGGAERRSGVSGDRVLRRLPSMVLQFDEVPRESALREEEVSQHSAWPAQEIPSSLMLSLAPVDRALKLVRVAVHISLF